MRIQSVSANSFIYNSQSSSESNHSAATKTTSSSYKYYDILEISDIDLGEDNTLDVQDIEKALQTETSKGNRNIRAAMRLALLQKPRLSNKGFDSPFLKNSPNEFISQAAKIYAAYLNPEMSGEDDKIFAYAGNDFEASFNQFVKDQSTQYANELAIFFSENGHPTTEQIDGLINEITQSVKEYGTKMAAGQEVAIEDLTTKLHINGVGISIGELNKVVATINDINPLKMILDSHADFAVSGLGVAKMKAFTTNSFSEPVAEMLMKTYNQKVSEEINKNDLEIELSKKTTKKNTFIERYLNGDSPEIKSKKEKNNTEDPYYKLDSKFKGSAKEEIFNQFSKIDVSNIDKSKGDYDKAVFEFQMNMKKWEHSRGYKLSSKDTLSNRLKISAAFEGLDEYISLAEKQK